MGPGKFFTSRSARHDKGFWENGNHPELGKAFRIFIFPDTTNRRWSTNSRVDQSRAFSPFGLDVSVSGGRRCRSATLAAPGFRDCNFLDRDPGEGTQALCCGGRYLIGRSIRFECGFGLPLSFKSRVASTSAKSSLPSPAMRERDTRLSSPGWPSPSWQSACFERFSMLDQGWS